MAVRQGSCIRENITSELLGIDQGPVFGVSRVEAIGVSVSGGQAVALGVGGSSIAAASSTGSGLRMALKLMICQDAGVSIRSIGRISDCLRSNGESCR